MQWCVRIRHQCNWKYFRRYKQAKTCFLERIGHNKSIYEKEKCSRRVKNQNKRASRIPL